MGDEKQGGTDFEDIENEDHKDALIKELQVDYEKYL
jgi:hypothetical protein